MNNLTTTPALPLLIQPGEMDAAGFINYFSQRKDAFEDLLQLYGSIKFTGIQIDSMQDFQCIVNGISTEFLNYVDGNSPRIKLAGNVYTSTEFDKSRKITMHNELSYSARWPNKLFFSCLLPGETGGETLLADSRKILRVMDPAIVEEVMARGLHYIRNLHGGNGLGPSWQDTFETNDKKEMEEYCRSNNIKYEWRDGDNLRLKQFSKGIIRHRTTGELLWFNQIDQFHASHLDEELYEVMRSIYESPDDFPLNVQFGDGKPISDELVKEIITTIDEVTLAPAWSRNELLIIDNELVCHGRNPYTGERRVLVSMSK